MVHSRLALTLAVIASLALSTQAVRSKVDSRLQASFVDATGIEPEVEDDDNKDDIQMEINMTPNVLVTKEGYWRASYPLYSDPKQGSVVKLFKKEHDARMWVYKNTGAHLSINYPMPEGLFPTNGVSKGVGNDAPEDEGVFIQTGEKFVDATGIEEEVEDDDNKDDIQMEINLTPNVLLTKEGYWRASYPLYSDPKQGSVIKLFKKEHDARMWVYKNTGAHLSINYPMPEGLFPVNGVVKGVGNDAPEDAFLLQKSSETTPDDTAQLLETMDKFVDATGVEPVVEDEDNKDDIQSEVNMTPNVLLTKEGQWRASYPLYEDPKKGSVVKLFAKEHDARMWVYKNTGAHESINYPMPEGLFPVNGVAKGVGNDAPEDAFLQVSNSGYSVAETTSGYWRATAPKGDAKLARMFHSESEANDWVTEHRAASASLIQSSEKFVDATGVEPVVEDDDNKDDIQMEINMTPNVLLTKEGYWQAFYPNYEDPKQGMVTKLFEKERDARMWVYKNTGAHLSINYPMPEGLFPVNGVVKGVGNDAPEDAFIQLSETEGSGSSDNDCADCKKRQDDIDVRA